MTNDEMLEVMRLIFAAWPSQRQRMSSDDRKAMYAVYTVGLEDLDIAKVKAAVTRLARTAEWLPTIAAIRAAVGVVEYGEQLAGAEAWEAVRAAIGSRGSNRTPGVDFLFTDSITDRVVHALGWRELCMSESAVADRARFIDAYELISATERLEAQASPGAINRQLERGPHALRELVGHVVSRLEDKRTPEEIAELSEMARRVATGAES